MNRRDSILNVMRKALLSGVSVKVEERRLEGGMPASTCAAVGSGERGSISLPAPFSSHWWFISTSVLSTPFDNDVSLFLRPSDMFDCFDCLFVCLFVRLFYCLLPFFALSDDYLTLFFSSFWLGCMLFL